LSLGRYLDDGSTTLQEVRHLAADKSGSHFSWLTDKINIQKLRLLTEQLQQCLELFDALPFVKEDGIMESICGSLPANSPFR
jgi:hypothetical protein